MTKIRMWELKVDHGFRFVVVARTITEAIKRCQTKTFANDEKVKLREIESIELIAEED